MPFDNTTLRQPTVTVLPPTPPVRGGGPICIHVQIEIVDRRQAQSRRFRFGMLTVWLLVLGLALARSAEGRDAGERMTRARCHHSSTATSPPNSSSSVSAASDARSRPIMAIRRLVTRCRKRTLFRGDLTAPPVRL
jgi:hypothetical protein